MRRGSNVSKNEIGSSFSSVNPITRIICLQNYLHQLHSMHHTHYIYARLCMKHCSIVVKHVHLQVPSLEMEKEGGGDLERSEPSQINVMLRCCPSERANCGENKQCWGYD